MAATSREVERWRIGEVAVLRVQLVFNLMRDKGDRRHHWNRKTHLILKHNDPQGSYTVQHKLFENNLPNLWEIFPKTYQTNSQMENSHKTFQSTQSNPFSEMLKNDKKNTGNEEG